MATKEVNLQHVDDLIFISDVHFGARAASDEWMDNFVDYFDNFFIPLLRSEVSTGRTPIVVVAGDYFENRNNINIDVLNRGITTIQKIVEVCPVYMMIGNHDIYKKDNLDVNSLVVFEHIKGVTVVKDKLVLRVKSDKTFQLVSWIGDMKKVNKLIAKSKENYDYIVLHTEINGMSYDNGRLITNGLNLSSFGDECRVLSGHIHKRQEGKNALYFGSPYHYRIDDAGNERGIYCFHIDGDIVNRVFKVNDYSPKMVVANFSDYGKNFNNWKDVIKNNYVKIVFENDDKKIVDVNKFVNELRDRYEPRKLEWDCKPATIIRDDFNVRKDASIDDVFNENVEKMEISDEEKESLRKYNKKYLEIAKIDN